MRITVDMDDDVLLAVKGIAKARRITVGRLLSELARTALTKLDTAALERDGVPLFPIQPGSGVVTAEIINLPRDETP